MVILDGGYFFQSGLFRRATLRLRPDDRKRMRTCQLSDKVACWRTDKLLSKKNIIDSPAGIVSNLKTAVNRVDGAMMWFFRSFQGVCQAICEDFVACCFGRKVEIACQYGGIIAGYLG